MCEYGEGEVRVFGDKFSFFTNGFACVYVHVCVRHVCVCVCVCVCMCVFLCYVCANVSAEFLFDMCIICFSCKLSN